MAYSLNKSNKGSNQLVFGSFIYVKERQIKDKIIWRCIEYNKIESGEPNKCRGRLHTNLVFTKFEEKGDHNHTPSSVDIKKIEVLT